MPVNARRFNQRMSLGVSQYAVKALHLMKIRRSVIQFVKYLAPMEYVLDRMYVNAMPGIIMKMTKQLAGQYVTVRCVDV